MHQTGLTELWVHTRIAASSAETISADIVIADISGKIVARLTGFTAKRTSAQSILSTSRTPGQDTRRCCTSWRGAPAPLASAPSADPHRRALVADREPEGSCSPLVALAHGARCSVRNHPRCGLRPLCFRAVQHGRGSSMTRAAAEPASDANSEWNHPEKKAIEFHSGVCEVAGRFESGSAETLGHLVIRRFYPALGGCFGRSGSAVGNDADVGARASGDISGADRCRALERRSG